MNDARVCPSVLSLQADYSTPGLSPKYSALFN